MHRPVILKKLKLNSSMNIKDLLELTHQKYVLFIIGDWNAKSRKFCLEYQEKLALENRMKQGKG